MSLKIKIAARLKVKAAGVNLSKERIDAIVLRAEKGLTDESDDTAIDANLDLINELTPFKEIASYDDHQRAKDKKIADDKEAARLKAIADGKEPEVEINPAETPMEKMIREMATGIKALTTEIANIKGQTVTQTRRESFIKAMEGTPAEYQAKELKRFDRISFKDDADFDSFLEDTKDDHAAAVQEDSNAGLGGDRPAGGAGGNAGTVKLASDAELDAVEKFI